MKVALTAIARHENKYLKEWIDFYQKMGINHIFLGDNNDTNDTEDDIKKKATEEENVKRHIEGKEIVKIIVIQKKIVNIVVK